jgi:hypothetical protein
VDGDDLAHVVGGYLGKGYTQGQQYQGETTGFGTGEQKRATENRKMKHETQTLFCFSFSV